jgi:tyrosyl-tRNA synthetase
MPDLFAELEWRGFVQQATPELRQHLAKGPATLYCGFDPTATSLQLGNLMPLMLLRHFQRAGHKPIVLMGGGTGLIGDPSGKRNERQLLSKEQIRENLQHQRDQMQRFLDFDPGPAQALVLNNADWLAKESLIDFLRDVGKHFTVNVMLQKESVQGRLDAGISFTEFSYMLLQAFDFLHLYRTHRCALQVGGSDQWGNITAGIDLIRRVEGGEAHGLVAPLVTTATGAKFGKSEAGAIWLDPALTRPYDLYQFWRNTDDRDVERYLKLFTLRTADDIRALMAEQAKDPGARAAQDALAQDVVSVVHGDDVTKSVVQAAQSLFGGGGGGGVDVGQHAPVTTLAARPATIVDALIAASLAKSKSEARRLIQQGGVYVNNERVSDVDRRLDAGDWKGAGRTDLLLRKGKKDYALLRVSN